MTDSVSPISTAVLPTSVRVVGPPTRGGDAGSDPPADPPVDDPRGNSSPEGGEVLPLSDEATTQSAALAVERLNELLTTAERRVRFRIDEESGKTLIFVVDAATGEIVRQIPADQLLTLARRVGVPGAILDAQV